MGRLWAIDDIAAYAVGVDASELIKMVGFPPGMKLPGIRGLRWCPPAVMTFFERLSAGDVAVDFVGSDEEGGPHVPVLPRMDLSDLKDVA